MRLTVNASELYARWVGIICLIVATMGAAYFYADFWGLSGLPGNWTLVAIYGVIGAAGAIVGMLMGRPEPCYAYTMVVGIILTLVGAASLIAPAYTTFWGGQSAKIGDGIFALIVGLIGVYIAFSSRVKHEGAEAPVARMVK